MSASLDKLRAAMETASPAQGEKKSFNDDLLIKNFNAIIETLEKEKANNSFKGEMIKNIYITSTMGISYKLKLDKHF